MPNRPAARCYAAPSGQGRCKNTTTHPSNRCHVHRQALVGATATATDGARDAAAAVAAADPFAAPAAPVDFTEDGVDWTIASDFNHRPYLTGQARGWLAQATQVGTGPEGRWSVTIWEDIPDEEGPAQYQVGSFDTAEQARAAAAKQIRLASRPEYDAPTDRPFQGLPARWAPDGQANLDRWDVTVSDDGRTVEMTRTLADEWVDPHSEVGVPSIRSVTIQAHLADDEEAGEAYVEVQYRSEQYLSGDTVEEEHADGRFKHTSPRATLDRLNTLHADDL